MNRQEFKNMLLTGWNFSRFLRLALGGLLAAQFLSSRDIFMGFMALTLILQAAFNVGCCTNGACDTRPVRKTHESKETTFEEIK